MTLGRRLGGQLSILIACVILTAGVGFWGVAGVQQDFSVALRNYERLRVLYQVGFHLQSARLALGLDFPDPQQARLETKKALSLFEQQAATLDAPAELEQRTRNALAAAAEAAEARRPSVRLVDAPLAALNDLVDFLRGQIHEAQSAADARTRRTILWIGIVAVAAVIMSVITGIRQFRAVMRPLGAIAEGTRRIADGAFDRPIDLGRADEEFAEVTRDFNAMADRLRRSYAELQSRVEAATRSAVQSERLAGVGLLAAGVAHEINNPLSIITGRLELILTRPLLDPALKSQVEVVLEEAFRCKRIIDRLLLLSRGSSGSRQRQRIDQVAEEVITSVRTLPAVQSRTIEMSLIPVTADVDSGELRQVLLNLLINALQFTGPAGRVSVSLQRAGSHAELTVNDDGVGMDSATLSRLFEPFFSPPRDGRRGTGLGLAISKAIIESHGGTIEAHSDGLGRGSRFVVRLPIVDDDSPAR